MAVVAWTYAGLAVLALATAWPTKGFHATPKPVESILTATAVSSFTPLFLVLALFPAAFALWVVFRVLTEFGTCMPGTCGGVPAVP